MLFLQPAVSKQRFITGLAAAIRRNRVDAYLTHGFSCPN
jgi:hypothetical protein